MPGGEPLRQSGPLALPRSGPAPGPGGPETCRKPSMSALTSTVYYITISFNIYVYLSVVSRQEAPVSGHGLCIKPARDPNRE